MTNISKPKIAILLATFNGQKYIKRQLFSILSQQKVSVDIFISDDLSTDKTIEICKSIMKNHLNIKILNQPEISFGSAAKNFFNMVCQIDFSSYSYLGFSDQDDIWKPFKLFKGIKKLETGYMGYSSNVKPFFEKKILKTVNKSSKQVMYDYLFEGGGAGSTYILKYEVMDSFKKILLQEKWIMNKINHHDWLIYAYTRHIYKYWYIDKFDSVYYRQHSHNELGSSDSFKAILKRLKLVLNGYALSQSSYIANAIKIDNKTYKKFYSSKAYGWNILFNFYNLRRSIKGKILIFIIGFIALIYPIKNDR